MCVVVFGYVSCGTRKSYVTRHKTTLAHVIHMLQCLNGVQGEVLNHARSKNTFFSIGPSQHLTL